MAAAKKCKVLNFHVLYFHVYKHLMLKHEVPKGDVKKDFNVFTPEEMTAFLSAVKGCSDYVPFRNNLTGTVSQAQLRLALPPPHLPS